MNTVINDSASCNSERFYGINKELHFTIDYI